jgi:hypothetical protein
MDDNPNPIPMTQAQMRVEEIQVRVAEIADRWLLN